MRRRVGTMVFAANVDASRGSFEPCGPQPPAAEARRLRPESQAPLCHSERSESTNAASAEIACGLYRARSRKTNEVQSNICILTIKILRRYAPQNDELLNCSPAPRQTGIYNWRQRKEDRGKSVQCGHGLQRNPALAVRAEAPPRGGSQYSPSLASAREYPL